MNKPTLIELKCCRTANKSEIRINVNHLQAPLTSVHLQAL